MSSVIVSAAHLRQLLRDRDDAGVWPVALRRRHRHACADRAQIEHQRMADVVAVAQIGEFQPLEIAKALPEGEDIAERFDRVAL